MAIDSFCPVTHFSFPRPRSLAPRRLRLRCPSAFSCRLARYSARQHTILSPAFHIPYFPFKLPRLLPPSLRSPPPFLPFLPPALSSPSVRYDIQTDVSPLLLIHYNFLPQAVLLSTSDSFPSLACSVLSVTFLALRCHL